MADSNVVEQAVSRTLRDNLERIQRGSDELHQALADVVSACASTRPTNALPPLVRAQAAAAGLSAVLGVLSQFVTAAMQLALQLPAEPKILRGTSLPTPEPSAPPERPEPTFPEAMAESPWTAPQATDVSPAEPAQAAEPLAADVSPAEPAQAAEPLAADVSPAEPVQVAEPLAADVSPAEPVQAADSFVPEVPASDEVVPSMDAPSPAEAPGVVDGEPPATAQPEPETAVPPSLTPEAPPADLPFNVASLSSEEQELHRRAYRVAKVSMQDIKMLRPEDVRLGRENKDLCIRLRDDIEKAHREYDRRFHSILDHPVDYFYDWMVDILAGGNPEALGEYPYSSQVLRR